MGIMGGIEVGGNREVFGWKETLCRPRWGLGARDGARFLGLTPQAKDMTSRRRDCGCGGRDLVASPRVYAGGACARGLQKASRSEIGDLR